MRLNIMKHDVCVINEGGEVRIFGQLLLVDKQNVPFYIKQHLKSLNVCTKFTQLPLLWQQ